MNSYNPEDYKSINTPTYKSYEEFHDDPNNSDINYVIEEFLKHTNNTTLQFLNYIENYDRYIFNYIINYTPYFKRFIKNRKIFIDYRNKIFKVKRPNNSRANTGKYRS
jgi:hypothetical protein